MSLPKILRGSQDSSAFKSVDSQMTRLSINQSPYLIQKETLQTTKKKRIIKCYPETSVLEISPAKRQYFRIQTEPGHQKAITEPEIDIEARIMKQLKSDEEEPFEDQKPRDLIGKEAVQSYFKTYKKLDRVREQNQFMSIQDSVQTSMLSQCESLNLLPCRLGVVKHRGNPKQLEIPRRHYGNNYSAVLTEGLKHMSAVTDFNLGYNRLHDNGSSQLLQQITKQARTLELPSNKVGRVGCQSIAKQIKNRECRIEILNLEDNALGDTATVQLCQALTLNSTILSLNLSRNFLTNSVTDVLCEVLQSCNSLEELYLHWNQIKGNGAQRMFEILSTECENLRVLDLSYNCMGLAGGSQFTATLAEFFKKNGTVQHLDLSVNTFNLNDCQSISNSIKSNRTIYGFHFSGNYGYIDSKGFLIIDENKVNLEEMHVQRRIKGVEPLRKSYSHAERIEKMKDICWICDGWHETNIEWVPGQSGDADTEPIFWHADYEGYGTLFLGRPDQSGIFKKKRMVPPGEMISFYTANDNQTSNALYPIKNCQEKLRQKITILDRKFETLVDEVNQQEWKGLNRILNDWQPTISILPRTPDEIYIPARRKKQKRVWTFPISIWAKKYKFETTEVLRKCFERDWQCSKLTKFIKSPEDQQLIMDMLWTNYKMIKETYKQYASYNPNGDVFSISQMPISELMNNCNIIDGKQLKLADLDLKFIATCSASAADWKGNYRNPDRAMVRFQLMEFLVRLAEDKFIRGNQGVTIIQAVTQLLDLCRAHMLTYDANKWRLEKYFVEQCDDICKKYKWVFDYLYARNSSKKVKPGQAAFMCLDELKDVCAGCSLYDENFVDRDVNMAFNLSMMTQVDELDSDRIFQMSWIEFLEAVARIAEKVSPAAIGAPDTLPYEKRFSQPLWYKIEALMVLFIRRMVDEDSKKYFTLPTISMFDVVEEDEYY